jgi:thiamine biosynthesis lipoprotein
VQVRERPADPEYVTVEVSGGLATSTTLVRRWQTATGPQHHLLDPRTGRPVPGVLRSATAVGDSCVAANTASTAALVLGDAAVPWLESHDVSARLVRADGSVVRTGDWPSSGEAS